VPCCRCHWALAPNKSRRSRMPSHVTMAKIWHDCCTTSKCNSTSSCCRCVQDIEEHRRFKWKSWARHWSFITIC
jgi:hypothetical protein